MDRYWLGFGIVGALQMGAIALGVGFVLYAICHRWFGRGGTHHGVMIGWSWLIATVLAGGPDLWDLFYFNVAPMQSLQLLRIKLAAVHDPDSIGLRVLFEMLGSAVGVALSWILFSSDLRRWLGLRGRSDDAKS
jgi:hypothetical protein